MKQLVIKRRRWLRGTGGGTLYRRGKMCCLGFYLRSLGMPPKVLKLGDMPCEIETPKEARWLTRGPLSTRAARQLANTNDNRDLDGDERERAVAKEFARHGVEVVFE